MKIICVGRNYSEHIAEMGNAIPDELVLFLKPQTALNLNAPRWFLPDMGSRIDYECELVIKVAKNGKHVATKYAGDYIGEIGLGIDFTARDLQQTLKSKGLPWDKAKAFDHSAVIGQMTSIAPEMYGNIDFWMTKNDEKVQQGNSREMIYDFAQIIVEASRYFTLHKGDLIFTGTPSGVGPVSRGDILRGYLQGVLNFECIIS